MSRDRYSLARALWEIFPAWWDRVRGQPRGPMPFKEARALDFPGRASLVAPSELLKTFGVDQGQIVLELGSATGFYSAEAARRVAPEGRLICLDVQPRMVEETQNRLQTSGEQGDCVAASALQLPLVDDCIDHTFFISVLGEIPDRRAVRRETRRVLRPGGHLSAWEIFFDPDFVTPGTLRRELISVGFEEERSFGLLGRHLQVIVHTSTWRLLDKPRGNRH